MIESVTSAAAIGAQSAYAADPSTTSTDPSTTSSASSTTSSSTSGMNGLLDPNEFLNLLVDNLKYQDPLDPTSSADLLTQLASLSQVQTQQQIAETDETSAAANLIGDTIAGSDVVRRCPSPGLSPASPSPPTGRRSMWARNRCRSATSAPSRPRPRHPASAS